MNKPFFHKHKRAWYLQVGKRQVRLAETKAEAFEKWHEMATGTPEKSTISVNDLYRKFLADVETSASKGTLNWYIYHLERFVAESIGEKNAENVIPLDVTSFMNGQKGWGQNSRHNFVRAAKRLFKWGYDQGVLKSNPLDRMAKPSPVVREDFVTDAQFEKIMSLLVDGPLKDLITMAWETGMRPQELFALEARHIHDSRVVFPASEAKGKRGPRVVYLGTEVSRNLAKKLSEKFPEGKLFRNARGGEWNKSSVKCAFQRLEKGTGLKTHLGAFRKGYCTRGLKNGVDTVTMSHLMGHASTAMVSRVYAKVHHDAEHMLAAAAKVMSGSSRASETPSQET